VPFCGEKKTPDDKQTQDLTPLASKELINRYEELRLQALGLSGSSQGLGLGLFLRQGMRSWMESWSKCAPPARPTQEVSICHSFPCELQGEVTNILAGLVLSSRRWEVNP
jgi:hypothetical protein